MKSGFVTFIGRPNVGKSSLINALVGEKVSIVSPKPQTTRDRIMGILNEPNAQIIFVDTPGVHTPKTKLGEYMIKSVKKATDDVDVLVYVFDASKNISDEDLVKVLSFTEHERSVVWVLNKIDLVSKEDLIILLKTIRPFASKIKDIVPCSCKRKLNIDTLKQLLIDLLPEGEPYFFDNEISDKPISYMICEIIREKALLLLDDEIPHGLGVVMQIYEKQDNRTYIKCDIICEKNSHKKIIIGYGGSMIRKIGQLARHNIEKLIDDKVYLDLYVKVREDWRNNVNYIKDVGYSDK